MTKTTTMTTFKRKWKKKKQNHDEDDDDDDDDVKKHYKRNDTGSDDDEYEMNTTTIILNDKAYYCDSASVHMRLMMIMKMMYLPAAVQPINRKWCCCYCQQPRSAHREWRDPGLELKERN